jgi:hypothetical protein
LGILGTSGYYQALGLSIKLLKFTMASLRALLEVPDQFDIEREVTLRKRRGGRLRDIY